MEKISVAKELSIYNLEGKWNDYIGVQKEVLQVLRDENFFDRGDIKNVNSGLLVRISPKGIKETLGKGNRFQILPKRLKVYKVAAIRYLPKLIETGYIIEDNVDNIHEEGGYKFAYICNDVKMDEEIVRIRISIKKKLNTNHFWIHNIDEYKKGSELLSPSKKTEIKRLKASFK